MESDADLAMDVIDELDDTVEPLWQLLVTCREDGTPLPVGVAGECRAALACLRRARKLLEGGRP